MNQHVGRQGESIISLLCSEEELTSNASKADDYGWDFHLEFPPTVVPRTPIDMQPGPHSALLQVKTTYRSVLSWPLKLSNALRLAKSPLPCFIALVRRWKKKTKPDQIYIVHVWTELIGFFLKEGRAADSRRCYEKHKVRLSVKFSADDDRSADPIGWMRRQIEAVGKDYAGAKQKINETIGFDGSYGTGEVIFEPGSVDELIDWHLGLKKA